MPYFCWIDNSEIEPEMKISKETDNLIREFLQNSAATFHIDDGDETYFRYWMEDNLKIRTCLECQISEFKSPTDGEWILYFTKKRVLWACEQIENKNYDLKCSLCEKWNNRWREKLTTSMTK